MARAWTLELVRPVLAEVQDRPPSVLRKAPVSVPASTVRQPPAATENTVLVERPAFAAVQVAPPSRLRKTPAPDTPTYRVEGEVESIASGCTVRSGRPLDAGVQVPPPFEVLKMPPPPL